MPALASQSRHHVGPGNSGPGRSGGGYDNNGGGYDSGAYYDNHAAPPQTATRGGVGHGSRHHHSTAAYFPDGSGHNRQRQSAGDYEAGAVIPQEQMQGADLASGGAGGLSGIRDPYDKPTRSQLAGAQSRLRQDKRSGALMEVAGRYRTLFAGHHIVRKGLRRSIGDAYAAYVGQVVNLPEDTYALALKALDATFSAKQQTNCAVDFNLWTSPFATSRAKHAQVFNTAKKIMRDLEGYVYDVSYHCPRQLDELRETRRRGGARTPGGESYKEGAVLQTADPPLHREAVPVARRAAPGAAGTHAATASGAHDATQPRVNPITGALRQPYDPQDPQYQQHHKSPSPTRPRTAPSAGTTQPRRARRAGPRDGDSSADERGEVGRRGAAGAARNVSAALDAAAVAAEEERDAQRPSGMPPGPRRLGFMGEQRLKGIRRLSSPGMYVKTPPHYKISNYYSHVSPTDDVLEFMHKRLVRQAEMRKLVQQDKVAAAAEAGVDFGKPPEEAAAAAAAAVDEAATQQQQQLAVMEKILKLGTRHAGPVPRGGKGAFQMGGGPGMGRSSARAAPGCDGNDAPVLMTTFNQPPAPDPAAVAAAAAAQRYAAGGDPATGAPPSETDRVMWIIETAYELGLAGVLGLEGPPQYPRSRRLSPVKYRRQYYDALYGNDNINYSRSSSNSPERYRRSDPGGAVAGAAPGGPPATPGMGVPHPPRAVSPSPQTPQTAAPASAYPQGQLPQHPGVAMPAAAAGQPAGGNPYGYVYPRPPEPRRPPPPGYYSHVPVPPDWQGPTAYSVEVAAARRRVQDAYPDPPAQRYPRSRRLSP
ncbi:hypothetical protein HYH02_002462 [Chlamydomonas schloesseri]|uniref:Uncharacterized protein n=1 Tax=Chlamydomonas schloesseri TaxID=2026947 RepID=A0A835WUV5_9CHLO|nr:hypothetical protein HYH02_002462 [Chlamydomonas schloesseri]|eukprot:KAG2453136.1 hypothetical protein HYH02_002462 [Chlamydomonas schloesseri]